jgi:acyl carrier protein
VTALVCWHYSSGKRRNLYGTEMLDNATPKPALPLPAEAPDNLMIEIAALIVTALNLDVAPSEIEPDAPLYGEGLGLDSIDILEVALEVSKQYGFHLRADNDDNIRIFKSLRSLTDHVWRNKAA